MKHFLLSVTSGLLLAMGWPTYGFPLFLFFGFVPLLMCEFELRNKKKSKLKVFGYAYLTFLIWNVISTWWIYNSTAIGMLIAVLVNSLLMTFVFSIYHMSTRKATFRLSSLFLVCLWIGFEYFHLQWQISWPWLNLGNGFADFTTWIQWYEFTGTFGGTLWVWIINIMLFKSILQFKANNDVKILYRSALITSLSIGIPILISIIILKTYKEKGDTIEVVLLQPNIDPYTEKYNTTDSKIGLLLQNLADSVCTEKTNFIIAPETVFADNNRLKRFPTSIAINTAKKLTEKFPKSNMISGVSLIDVFKDSSRVKKQTNFHKKGFYYDDYNSAFFVRPDGSHELYHKSKLVVGIENFPYQSVLKPLLGNVMIDLGGTVAKKTTQSDREVFFTNDQVGIGTMICYESIYGEFATGFVRNKADFLAVITNDAWWGNTQGHKQHLSYAKLRAIETRRSIARSANTGISAIIDQRGNIVNSLGYEKQGALKGTLYTNEKITFYVQFGNYIARIAIFLGTLILLYLIAPRKRQQT